MAAEVRAEAERIIAEYPRRELVVVFLNRMRDMSIVNVDRSQAVIPYNEIHKGEVLDTLPQRWGQVKVVDASEERLVLWWDPNEYTVEIGHKVKTETYAVENAYLTHQSIGLEFEYRYITVRDIMFSTAQKVCDAHAYEMGDKSVYHKTTRDEMLALRLLDELISEGEIELYPLKALLHASNNWATGVIARQSFYRQILLEGIEQGCLAPENDAAWEWIDVATNVNDPSTFMDDADRWYDILATAVEHGNQVARRVMDIIWEPEQIIEED